MSAEELTQKVLDYLTPGSFNFDGLLAIVGDRNTALRIWDAWFFSENTAQEVAEEINAMYNPNLKGAITWSTCL